MRRIAREEKLTCKEYLYADRHKMPSPPYFEPLEEDELAFIRKKHDTESRSYVYAMNRLVVLAALVPAVVAFGYYVVTEKQDMLYRVYFTGLAFLLVFFSFVAWMSYRHKLQKFKRDLAHRQKVIEPCTIESARFMPQNQTYHFFIHSRVKLSIEVDENTFQRLQEGDEINIEYAPYSGEYFGYF